MSEQNKRRAFLKTIAVGGMGAAVAPSTLLQAGEPATKAGEATPPPVTTSNYIAPKRDKYNSPYTGENLSRLAFPIGGIGAGMFCLEGTGAVSHMSIRNHPDVFNEPSMFAAISVKGRTNGVKILEGPVPTWKLFGQKGTGNGASGTTFGLPRFREATFNTAFPFAEIELKDDDIPLSVKLTGWSPFIPTDEDNSSLPVGAFEYEFVNNGNTAAESVFSYSSKNFLSGPAEENGENSIGKIKNGFLLQVEGSKAKPWMKGSFAIFTDQSETIVDHCWFRGGWWDPITMAWNNIRDANTKPVEPVEKDAPGATLYVKFTLQPGEKKKIKLLSAWYVPETNLKVGKKGTNDKENCDPASGCCSAPEDIGIKTGKKTNAENYKPWYSSKFDSIQDLIEYWTTGYDGLFEKSTLFRKAFYSSTLPAEVIEAVAANLTIIKSPTVLRQYDGKLWAWEGCADDTGCCHGSCTHVWNYAQAIPHLFPNLERSLRHTEFCENQNKSGHQVFRANMPISIPNHDFHSASDGQLGGIMKVHRDWRISGDNQWLAKLYPMVKVSMDYCIKTWDPRGKGLVEEPHHNTYDIEFWGPDAMITSFYLGALQAMIEMGVQLKKDSKKYKGLLAKGKAALESRLYNGEFFHQDIQYEGLSAPDPTKVKSFGGDYSEEAKEILKKEGPKYQYGLGCLSDGVLGVWIASVCGLPDFVDAKKVESHLLSVHKYNLRTNLSEHANPQRPSYALGNEGGLLLCTWPKGGKLSLPFVYSDEVWTGIEYQVAAHLMLIGKVKEGLDIVRLCRDRYDGRFRNPFNEYECGHWYARAMSSFGMLQGLTGQRYDAVDKTLYINSKVGDFKSFISTATGFGTVSLKNEQPSIEVAYGTIDVKKMVVNGKTVKA